jgi:cation diffusion facilitator CzcD-associated flavoprotein CzcO
VRSDSDLFTFGYSFKPWTEDPIATGARILAYLEAVIDESGLARHIRYGHRVTSAEWSAAEALWTLRVKLAEGSGRSLRTHFLWMGQGYYRHDEGYTPSWPGMENFHGQIVHPQKWPADLDLTDRKIALVGSGATAATILPSLARTARHVTLVQRSPTYFNPGTNADALADELRALEIDEHLIHAILRKKLLAEQKSWIARSAAEPEAFAAELIGKVVEHLGTGIDVAKHFTPRYRPWQQRVAFVPDGDFFTPFREGEADVVTGLIERFTETGLRMDDGTEIEADLVVTATGFKLSVLGDIPCSQDGVPIDFANTVTWQGMMFTGVPNMVWVFGYFRASLTLRVEMIAEVTCRILNHMDQACVRSVTVEIPDHLRSLPHLPWVDLENFNPGYLMRGIHLLPRRLDLAAWQHTQDYWSEVGRFARISVSDEALIYA